MSRPALCFRGIHVRRMPGFEPPGFEVGDLSPGINIVHGPNGVGKSTLARAMLAVLWPQQTGEASVLARVEAEGGECLVRLEGERTRWQRDGADAPAPVLPAVDARDRYWLALHDLLQSETTNRGFADAILRESSGGFDLARAGESLRLRDGPGKATSQRQAVRRARDRLTDVRRKQEGLYGDEEKLVELEARAAVVAKARQRVAVLGLAEERCRALRDCELARKECEGFPRAVSRMSGAEEESWRGFRKDLQTLEGQKEEILGNIARCRRELAALGLPSEGVPSRALPELRDRLSRLQALDTEQGEVERELERLKTLRDEARRLLVDARNQGDPRNDGDEARLRDLDLEGLGDLSEVARRVEELRAARKACQARLALLGDSDAPSNLDRLREGCRLLRLWLRVRADESPQIRASRWTATVGGLVVLVAAVVLGLQVHAGWLGLGVIGAALIIAAWWRSDGSQEAALFQKEFVRLGLDEAPPGWDPEAVRERLDALEEALAAGMLAAEKASARTDLLQRLDDCESESSSLETRCREVSASLGVTPDTEASSLLWLVQTVTEWQRADREVRGLEARLGRLQAQREAQRAPVGQALAAYGVESLGDTAALLGSVSELDDRCRKHAEASSTLEREESRLLENETRRGGLERARDALFAKLDLQPGDEAGLQDLERKHAAWVRAARERENAESYLRKTEERLRQHPLFEDTLCGQSLEELEAERAKAERDAEAWDRLNREIARIQALVGEAREAHDLEDALAGWEGALAALEEKAREDYDGVAGFTLVEHLKAATRDRERPAVFHAAREIFARITGGRYELKFAGGDAPAFRAQDTVSGIGHGLDELSSGTRVQLLLAVRLAFVERQEAGLRLPLILDEALGNSDDSRAQAIQRAVVELARSGRQVFCLTAQADEVAKWMAVLRERGDVAHCSVDLARIRGLSEGDGPLDWKGLETPAPTVPEPEDRSHSAYGALLDVPAIDPAKGPGAVHVWHVVEDPAVLHGLLGLGVERLGPLRTLLAHGGGELLGDERSRRRVESASRAVEALCDAVRVGRGRRVDRATLVASEALSSHFLDRVADLAETLGGDGERLMAALHDGQVKRLRSESIERLGAYLEEQGHVDPEPPLEPQEVRARVVATVADDLARGDIEEATVERLLRAVGV